MLVIGSAARGPQSMVHTLWYCRQDSFWRQLLTAFDELSSSRAEDVDDSLGEDLKHLEAMSSTLP